MVKAFSSSSQLYEMREITWSFYLCPVPWGSIYICIVNGFKQLMQQRNRVCPNKLQLPPITLRLKGFWDALKLAAASVDRNKSACTN